MKYTVRIKRWEILDFLIEAEDVEAAKIVAADSMQNGEGDVTAEGDEVFEATTTDDTRPA